MLDEMRADIHGMVHCTGGAQTKVLHFVGESYRVVKDNMFPVPPLFKAIAKESGTDWSEMYKVFNMGIASKSTLLPSTPNKSSPSPRVSTSTRKSSDTSKKDRVR